MIDLTKSRSSTDFGLGFYTTSKRSQAIEWARRKILGLSPAQRAVIRPAVLRFRVELEALAKLKHLAFVRGSPDNVLFWSFVQNCRSSNTHLRPSPPAFSAWYDLVCGPIASKWPPLGAEVASDSDQFSFHTMDGIAVLNDIIKAGPPNFWESISP